MPKGFNEKEKVYIRQKLLEVGKELFGRYGLKKTSIDEAVKRAGISKGAFYLFYSSKELYFMEVLESLEKEVKEGMLVTLRNSSLSPVERFKAYMRQSLEYMEKNPIMTKMSQQDLEVLMVNLPPEKLKEHMDSDLGYIVDFLSEVNGPDALPGKINSEALQGFFKFMFYIFLHKGEMARSEYEAGMELYIDMAASYLIKQNP